MNDGDLAGRALRATRSNLLTFPLLAICAFAAGIVVARILSVPEFGVYALALALRGTVQFLADLGTGTASARAFAQLESAGRRASAVRLYRRLALARGSAALLVAIGSVLAADQILDYLDLGSDQHQVLWWLVVMGVAEIVGGLGVYVLTGTLGQRWLNRVLLLSGVAQPLLVISAALAGLGLTGVLAALAVTSIGKAVALHVGAVRSLQRLQSHGEDGSSLAGSLVRTAGAASVGKLASWVHTRAALSLFLLPAAGSAEFAVFALGYDLAHQLMALVAAPAGNVVPAVVAKTTGDRERLRRIISPVISFLLTAATGYGLAVALAIPVLDGPLYGVPYADIGRYVSVLVPALVAELALATPATAILLADDRLLRRFTIVRALELGLLVLYPIAGFERLIEVTAIMSAVRCGTAVALIAIAQASVGRLLPTAWPPRLFVAALVS